MTDPQRTEGTPSRAAMNLPIVRALMATGGDMAVADHVGRLRVQRDDLVAALRASQARLYPDASFETYLDDLVRAAGDIMEDADDYAATAVRQMAEAIDTLRRSRDELRADLNRVALATPSDPQTEEPPR
jgi:hypothetical protein